MSELTKQLNEILERQDELNERLGDVEAQVFGGVTECRVCGCTDDNACEGGCSWVEEDLCSTCAESTPVWTHKSSGLWNCCIGDVDEEGDGVRVVVGEFGIAVVSEAGPWLSDTERRMLIRALQGDGLPAETIGGVR